MKKNNQQKFSKGDWISTTEIKALSGQKYTSAFVLKVKNSGKLLDVSYGSWMSLATVKAKNCKLLKKG